MKMNSRKLAKIIKLIVEHELKRQLPKLINEGVDKCLRKNQRTREILEVAETTFSNNVETETDLFENAANVLERSRNGSSNKPNLRKLSKNPILNEILNKTKPFDASHSLTENTEEWQTMEFDSNIARGGAGGMKDQMSAKLGHGGSPSPINTTSNKPGLKISTGLKGLDRVLNRDNSELVKRFKTRK